MNPEDQLNDRIQRLAKSFIEIAPSVVLALRARMGASAEIAADVTQDAFVGFLDKIRSGKSDQTLVELLDRTKLKAYVTKAVLNLYRDHLRHSAVMQRSQKELLRALTQEKLGPIDSVIHEEEATWLNQAVEALEEPYRSLFSSLLKEDITLAEYARERNIKLGTIYTQFQRGLNALRKLWLAAGSK